MLNILFVCRNGSGAGRSDVDLYAFVRRRVEGNGSLESQHCEKGQRKHDFFHGIHLCLSVQPCPRGGWFSFRQAYKKRGTEL